MPREHDYHNDATTTPASGEPIGDALEPQSTASDVSENGESARASARRPVRAAPPAAGANSSAETPRERESPLITSLEIENFKGIGRPVRVDLRPITLLFGRNSAGKSTVLHALCYAHEILSHRNVDARETELGGDQIDLGGFRRFVHGHDLKRSVRLRFELHLRGLVLPELGGIYEAMPIGWSSPAFHEPVSLEEAETGWLELRVTWNAEQDKPIVSNYEVGVDGQTVGHIEASASGRMATLLANVSHPLFGHEGDLEESDTSSRYAGQVREDAGVEPRVHGLRPMKVLLEPLSALPSFRQHLWISDDEAPGNESRDLYFDMSRLLAGIGSLLRDELARLRYLGPLRDLHPRTVVERERSVPGRWADGSAAWDLLNGGAQVTLSRIARDFLDQRERRQSTIIPDVSEWLSREDRLDTGYELRVRNVVDLPANTPLVDMLNEGVLLGEWAAIRAKETNLSRAAYGDVLRKAPPDQIDALAHGIANAPVRREIQLVATRADLPVRTSDIGVGVSQLLPVVVAALDPGRPEITAIEQPELHVHPRLQVELGDLFAEQAGRGRVFLIETHSEHLLLRIMRRMRETSAGMLPEGAPAVRPEDVSVLFVEPDGPQTLIREMPLNERGELVKAWPGGFFEEDLKEIF